jgi:hypothetical protein
MSDSEDENIRRAIALSLQENLSQPSKPTFIDLTSDDEDDDLDAPVHTRVSNPVNQPTQNKEGRGSVITDQRLPALVPNKQGDDQKKSLAPSSVKPQLVSDIPPKTRSPSVGSAMLGLDRAQMEADRLARFHQKKKHDEEAISALINSGGLNDPRKRKASNPDILPRTQNGRPVRPKYSTPSQHAEDDISTPNSALPSELTSGSQTKDAPLTQDSRLLALRESISGRDGTQPLKTTSQRGSRMKEVLFKQDPQSFSSGETKSGTDSGLPSKAPTYYMASEAPPFNQRQAFPVSGVQYCDGVVKRTWVRGFPPEDDVIKIEDVFQKDDLELAVLSTFQVDPDWVSTKLLEKTKVIWVLSARDEEEVSRRCFVSYCRSRLFCVYFFCLVWLDGIFPA